jgi:Spy/CpxP family protein refolding chaperone
MVNRARLRTYAIALAIFVLGAVAGGAVSYALSERHQREFAEGGVEAFEQRKLRGLVRKLDLSDDQKERVRAILRDQRETRRKLTREVFERCGESLGHHRDQADARIRAVLGPEQQKRFDELLRDHRHDPLGGSPRDHGPPRPRGP